MTEWSEKCKVIRHYDRIAEIYESQYAEEQTAKLNVILHNLELDEESLILDVGCGTGVLLPFVARAKLVVGIDISSKLLQKAKQHAKRALNTHLICADSDHLPIQDRVFNMVFAITLLQNIPNPLTTLEEVKRTSKERTVIAVTALKKQFSKRRFTELLENARLEVLSLRTDEKLKDIIAICQTQRNQ